MAELEHSLSSRELSEWMAYDRLDLIPDSWQQAGTIAAVMANLWTDRRHRPEDFIPRPRRARVLSAESGLAWFKSIAAAAAAKLKREESPSPPSAGSRSASPPTAPPSSRA